MASILILTALAGDPTVTRTKAAFVAAGHTVTITTEVGVAQLNAAWGSGHDLIASVNLNQSFDVTSWVAAKWAAGVPVLVGGPQYSSATTHLGKSLGILAAHVERSPTLADEPQYMQSLATHPILASMPDPVTISVDYNWSTRDTGTPAGLSLGMVGQSTPSSPGHYMTAVEVGDALVTSGTAPARAVFIGWAFPNRGDYSANGKTILANAVTWLVPAPGATTGTVHATASAPTVTISGNVTAPTTGMVTATASAPVVTISGDTPEPATTGAVNAVASSPVVSISDTVTPEDVRLGLRFGLAFTDSTITFVSEDVALGIRVGMSYIDMVIDAIEPEVRLGLGFGLRARESRDWGVPTGSTRPMPSVVITTRAGLPVAPLADVTISPLSFRAVGALDSWRFSVDRDDEAARIIDPVAHEVHLYRGTVLMSKGPIGPGRLENGRMVYDVSDPRWYLYSGRRIGRVPKLNWCYNGDFALGTVGWAGGYDEGSALAAAPEFSVVDEAESTSGKGLRIGSVDKVVTAKATVETQAVFYPNRPYAWESYPAGFLPGGTQGIIDVADTMTGPNPVVHVVGHTADADSGTGQALSERRAEWAKQVILGVWPGAVVTTEGKGETQPVATNATLEGQAKNRRVEIFYSTTQTATGHRQFVWQARNVVNPVDSLVPLPVTVSGRMRIGEWLGAPLDGWALRLMLMQGSTIVTDVDGRLVEATASMSETTPRVRMHEYSATIDIPPDGVTYRLVWRLYGPAGWSVWSDVGVYPSEQLGFFDVDQAHIIRDLTEHVQDVLMGKGDLSIGTRTPATGILRTREYPFHERRPYATAVEELVALARGVEVDCEVTPSSSTIVTHYPRQGGVAGLSLAHGGPRSIVKAYQPIPSRSTSLASSVIVQAWGISATRVERYARDEAALGGTLLEDVIEADGEAPPVELQELATQALARSIHPRAAYELVLDPSRTSEVLDEIGKGDSTLVSLPDEAAHGLRRLVQWTWDPDTDGLTVQASEEA